LVVEKPVQCSAFIGTIEGKSVFLALESVAPLRNPSAEGKEQAASKGATRTDLRQGVRSKHWLSARLAVEQELLNRTTEGRDDFELLSRLGVKEYQGFMPRDGAVSARKKLPELFLRLYACTSPVKYRVARVAGANVTRNGNDHR
jgi:hypothetical protein